MATAGQSAYSVFRFGDFELHRDIPELRKFGLRVKLQRKPLLILIGLLENAGEVVTRDQLQRTLWTDDVFVDFELGLNVAVKKLRDTLCDSAEQPRFIETVVGSGYRFIEKVERVPDIAEPPTASALQAIPPRPFSADDFGKAGSAPFRLERKPLKLQIAGYALLAFVLASGAYRFVIGGDAAAAALPTTTIQSLAVLPLKTAGIGGRGDIAGAMDEELVSALSSTNLSVLSSARAEVAASDEGGYYGLEVDAVLQGTVRKYGDRTRVHLELVNSKTGFELWSGDYVLQGDLLSGEQQAATKAVNDLRQKLGI